MATLYQLHSSMDKLERSTEELSRTWHAGDSILLLGTTVAFIDWLNASLGENDINSIAGIYALTDDVAQLTPNIATQNIATQLNLAAKLTGLLTDDEWVTLTQNSQFDKVVTVAL